MSRWLGKIKAWCQGQNSLFVQVFPTGFVLCMSLGGGQSFKNGELGEFFFLLCICCLITFLLIFLPVSFFQNGKASRAHSNIEVLFGELVIAAGAIWFYLENIAA